MINKIYKRIHNKFSTLFNFLFFLRYLFGIFFISIVSFLLIPHFFDLNKKSEVIKNHLIQSHGIKLNNYENIKYSSIPQPNLEIKNAILGAEKGKLKIKVKNLIIYPKLLSIYNYNKFETKKIILNKSTVLLQDTDLKTFISYTRYLKNKIFFKNLTIKIYRDDTLLVNLKKINFSNYGHNKNIIRGELFDKKFKIKTSDDYNEINFKLIKTGIDIDIIFNNDKKDTFSGGLLKAKLLGSNLKLNFVYENDKLKLFNSYFRSKNLSLNNESEIIYQPFFSVNTISNIENINIKLLRKLNLYKILSLKELIKKINIKNQINFKSKKFDKNLIDDLKLNINLAYGSIFYSKKIMILESSITCKGDVNLLKEYPILNFNCSILSNNKKKLFKKFSIKNNNQTKQFKFDISGNINILNNKINFKNIIISDEYNASKEDMRYYKQSFEAVFYNEDFFGLFNLKKIKKLFFEIS